MNALSSSTNMIRVKINNKWLTNCLIDSGASKSAADAAYIKRLGLTVRTLDESDPKFLLTANAQPVHCVGKVDLNFCVQGLNIVQTCLVLPNLSNDILLGTDFLIDKKAILILKLLAFHCMVMSYELHLRKAQGVAVWLC